MTATDHKLQQLVAEYEQAWRRADAANTRETDLRRQFEEATHAASRAGAARDQAQVAIIRHLYERAKMAATEPTSVEALRDQLERYVSSRPPAWMRNLEAPVEVDSRDLNRP